MQKILRKGLKLLGGFHQPLEDRVWIDLEDSRRAPDAQAFGQTRDDAHDELHRGAFALKDRAVGFVEVSATRDTLQLPPGLRAGMAVGADVAAAEPAPVGTTWGGTKVRVVSLDSVDEMRTTRACSLSTPGARDTIHLRIAL